MTRQCDNCGMKLPGKLGHGFLVKDARLLYCGDCANPFKDKNRKERITIL